MRRVGEFYIFRGREMRNRIQKFLKVVDDEVADSETRERLSLKLYEALDFSEDFQTNSYLNKPIKKVRGMINPGIYLFLIQSGVRKIRDLTDHSEKHFPRLEALSYHSLSGVENSVLKPNGLALKTGLLENARRRLMTITLEGGERLSQVG